MLLWWRLYNIKNLATFCFCIGKAGCCCQSATFLRNSGKELCFHLKLCKNLAQNLLFIAKSETFATTNPTCLCVNSQKAVLMKLFSIKRQHFVEKCCLCFFENLRQLVFFCEHPTEYIVFPKLHKKWHIFFQNAINNHYLIGDMSRERLFKHLSLSLSKNCFCHQCFYYCFVPLAAHVNCITIKFLLFKMKYLL